jgi:putative transposase
MRSPPRTTQGFSLHAGVHLHANDRQGLAHLCGYGARPPLTQERLSALPDGKLAYRMKRAHLVRYHGVFGPASKWRREILGHLGLPTTGPPTAPARLPALAQASLLQDDVPELQQSLR